jgi:prepilin peptidase CpaA
LTISKTVTFGPNSCIFDFKNFGHGIATKRKQRQLPRPLHALGWGKGGLGMHWLAWWPTMIVLCVATISDLRSRRIPNWLVFPFLAAGIVLSPWRSDWNGVRKGFWLHADWSSIRQDVWPGSGQGFSWHGLGQSCAGVGLGFLLFGILFWKFGMGAGDVKLAAAIGAWIGPQQLLYALLFTSLAGGILALGWIAYLKIFRGLMRGAGDLIFGRKSEMQDNQENSVAHLLKRSMPYAPAIAIGTFMSFLVS